MHYTIEQYKKMIQEVFDYCVRSSEKDAYITVPDAVIEMASQVIEKKYDDIFDEMDAENKSLPIRSYLRKSVFVLSSIFNEEFFVSEEKIYKMTNQVRFRIYNQEERKEPFNKSYQGLTGYLKPQIMQEIETRKKELAGIDTLNDPILIKLREELEAMPDELYGWGAAQKQVEINRKYDEREKKIIEQQKYLKTHIKQLEQILQFPDYEDAYIYCQNNVPLVPAVYDKYGFQLNKECFGYRIDKLELNPELLKLIFERFPQVPTIGLSAKDIFQGIEKSTQKITRKGNASGGMLKSRTGKKYKLAQKTEMQPSFLDADGNIKHEFDNSQKHDDMQL